MTGCDGVTQATRLRDGQAVGRAQRVNPGEVQRLVGVDVADPGGYRLVEDDRLDRGPANGVRAASGNRRMPRSPTGTTARACSIATGACGSTSCWPTTRLPQPSGAPTSTATRARVHARQTTRRS